MPEHGKRQHPGGLHLGEHLGVSRAGAHETLEMIAALVLAIVAIATAWSGYHAALWTGRQAELYGVAGKLRIQADGALNADGMKLAKEWDPARDEASGEQCKSYGAAAIMGIPGRFHITWDNDATLKIETEVGTQTRLLHFNAAPPQTEAPSWQGYSVAAWDSTLKHGNQGGSLKVTTANLRPGYLRKNGVPYSGKTTVTEYYDLVREPDGAVLVVNTTVEDPTYD